jgi:hypothetical protein
VDDDFPSLVFLTADETCFKGVLPFSCWRLFGVALDGAGPLVET